MLRSLLALPLAALFAGCFGTSSGDPCQDYCDYVCECHAGEEGFDCDECRTSLDTTDPTLQDECETELVTLQAEDQDAGTGCFAEEFDTARR